MLAVAKDLAAAEVRPWHGTVCFTHPTNAGGILAVSRVVVIERGGPALTIHLIQDELTFLEQLVRRYKVTKRQKAQALLGLAAGEPADAVAMRIGIAKEVVTELAAGFAERGLAGVGLSPRPEIVVTLAIPSLQDDLLSEQYRAILKARGQALAQEEASVE